jgi:hypothetical protein
MSVYYALCHGASLRLCGTCRRHVDHNPFAAIDPYQPFTTPQTRGEQCGAWLAKTSQLNFPKSDTGD